MRIPLLLLFTITCIFGSAQSWTPISNLPIGKHHPVSFSLNGIGYIVTGTNSNDLPTKDFVQYDTLTDSWTSLSDFPGTARSFAIGTTLNGEAYMGFGASLTQYLDDFWRYNPQTDQWTQLASCPCTGRRHPAMIAMGDKIYVGLGDDINGNLRDWWMYTVSTDSWVQIANLPGVPRHHPFQFSANGEVFAGMGHGAGIFDDWYKLDTSTNSWIKVNDFPGESRVAGTQFSWNNFGFVLSGDGSDHSFMQTGEMWRYNTATDSWTQFTAHPGVSRWAPGSFVIGDNVYFFGGYNRQTQQYPVSAYKFNLASATIGLTEAGLFKSAIYPNPAQHYVRWQAQEELSAVQIVNQAGQIVASAAAKEEKLNVEHLKAGLYIVHFKGENGVTHTQKLLKQ